MYTKEEASALRQKFWISFGKYMSPVPSASGVKLNWINYRTGIKFIHFKMDADSKHAFVAIEISHKDASIPELYFNQFKALQKEMENLFGEKWNWQLNAINDSGKNSCRIYTTLDKVNVFDEKDWPKIISFLKTRIIALDKFWNEYHDIFELRF